MKKTPAASPDQQEIYRAKVNLETSRIAWKDLQKYFASGAVVATRDLGNVGDAATPFEWDGLDDSGNSLPAGNYKIAIEGVAFNAAQPLRAYQRFTGDFEFAIVVRRFYFGCGGNVG